MPLQAIVPDIYNETILPNLVLGFFEPDFEAIDANREMTWKIDLAVKKCFYQQKEGEGPDLHPSGPVKRREYSRKMPDACTKEDVRKYIREKLEDCWSLVLEKEPYREKGRIRAVIGEVELSILARESGEPNKFSYLNLRIVPYAIGNKGVVFS